MKTDNIQLSECIKYIHYLYIEFIVQRNFYIEYKVQLMI